jgi:hypothetical protein
MALTHPLGRNYWEKLQLGDVKSRKINSSKSYEHKKFNEQKGNLQGPGC